MQGIPDLELIKRLAIKAEADATHRRVSLIAPAVVSVIVVAVVLFAAIALQ